MAINRDAFIDQYCSELEENIQSIDNTIILLKKDPENQEELHRMLRVLHTIKGSSRMLKFETMEKISHGLENVFKGVKENRFSISPSLVKLVFITTDFLKKGVSSIRQVKNDTLEVTQLLKTYERAAANEPYTTDSLESGNEPEAAPVERNAEGVRTPESKGEMTGQTKQVRTDTPAPSHDALKDLQSVRIRIDQIDSIIRQMNNLIINQFQLKKHYDLLQIFEQRFLDYQDSLPARDIAGSERTTEIVKSGKALSKEVQKIKKGLDEQIKLMERDTFELQEEIIGLRMFPLELILGSLPKMAEEIMMKLDKEVEFVIRGGDLKLDKLILENIQDPIIHILRNSLDHGIETPAEREAAGKARIGSLVLECFGETGNIIISIKDDGKGIDFERVRTRAMEFHPSRRDDIQTMGSQELLSYLFMPGFSTREDATDLSGRGVGLDIVRYNIEKIKGKITVRSEPGQGTEFIITLPLSLATIQGYFILSGGEKFFVPSQFIREISLLNRKEVFKVLNRDAFKLRDAVVYLYNLGYLMNLEGRQEQTGERIFVLVVESLGDVIGIVVDAVQEFASLIYKPLPSHMKNLGQVPGIVFDESYNIVNILHVPSLVDQFKSLKDIDIKKRHAGESEKNIRILVIDDSINSREIEKTILQSAGFQVQTAVDGIDGLEKLHSEDFQAVVTDLNMPRMDGFTLIENLRRDKAYSSLPIIVVSAYEEPASRKKAIGMGADRYLVKSDFDRHNLVDAVRELLKSREV